jgi:platelet-activating factor acetylhydrolase
MYTYQYSLFVTLFSPFVRRNCVEVPMAAHLSVSPPLDILAFALLQNLQVAVADLEPAVENGTIVRLYYPCGAAAIDDARGRVATEAAWLPSWRYAQGYGEYAKVPAVLAVPVFMLVAGWQRMPCAVNRPLVCEANNPTYKSERRTSTEQLAHFPVMIFSHGLAGMRTTYSALCIDFASAGYVVAAVEHRDGSACCTFREGIKVPHRGTTPESEAADGSLTFRRSQLSQRATEIEAARGVLVDLHAGKPPRCLGPRDRNRLAHAESFAGRLDLGAVVLAGHSFGAATALTTAMKSEPGRYVAVLAFDAWLYAISPDDIDARRDALPPTLFINNEKFQWRSNLDKMSRFFPPGDPSVDRGESAPSKPRSAAAIATLRGAGHMSQSDFPLLMRRLLKIAGVRSDVCALRLLDLNRRLGHSFLARHLGRPDSDSMSSVDLWVDGTEGVIGAEMPPEVDVAVL